MRCQLIRDFAKGALAQSLQHGRMLLICTSDARRLGEIQATDDSDSLCDLQVNARELPITGCSNQGTMEFLIPLRDLEMLLLRFEELTCHMASSGSKIKFSSFRLRSFMLCTEVCSSRILNS